MFGKSRSSAKNFLNSDAGQALLSTLSVFVPGDPYGFVQRRRREEQEAAQQNAQREQFGTALSDLMSQMRGPDTMTPQVNELIGGANMRGGQVGMAPMQMQTPRRAGLDYSDPATRDAFQRFIMAGGKPEFAQGIAESMQPEKPTTWTLSRGQRVVDEAGNTIAEGMPYEERPLVVPQGGSVFWPGQQKPGYVAPKTFAPPRGPAPGAGRGGASSSGLPPGYVVR
jgi:hypothetical protein